jgi:hypothetical protein
MGHRCPECDAILRELVEAPHSDAEKLRKDWLDLKELRDTWLASRFRV